MSPIIFDFDFALGTVDLAESYPLIRLDNGEETEPYPIGTSWRVLAVLLDIGNGKPGWLVVPGDETDGKGRPVPCAIGDAPGVGFLRF